MQFYKIIVLYMIELSLIFLIKVMKGFFGEDFMWLCVRTMDLWQIANLNIPYIYIRIF